jgi:malate dehydrogenase (oxaloacetate-decarboxylating)
MAVDHANKLKISSNYKLDSKEILSEVYTPGIADVAMEIFRNPERASDLTLSGKLVAVISDGTAVLGLGDIGPRASLPILEGKCLIFNEFAGIQAIPICLDTKDPDEIIRTVQILAPNLAAINLEDINAPKCFYIEERLSELLDIPVMHDDQHGTAIVTLAGLKNALKITGKKDIIVTIIGAGAAGIAIARLLSTERVKKDLAIADVILVDSVAIVSKERTDLNDVKVKALEYTNRTDVSGSLEDALKQSDVVVGVSKAGLLTQDMVRSMKPSPIVFGLANPTPEIMPELAKAAGASVVATGRSDFPNQINNALAYPGVFKGFLKHGIKKVTIDMKINAAYAIADHVADINPDNILPSLLDKSLPDIICDTIV